jgi:hypothetical protein
VPRGAKAGDPNFHQLEPDGELATPTPRAPSRIVKQGRSLRITSSWIGAGAGEPVAEHCGVHWEYRFVSAAARRERSRRRLNVGAP